MVALVVEPAFGLGRDALAAALKGEGIETRTFFCGMHRQPFLTSMPGWRDVPCPVADRLWERGLYLPSASTLTEETVARVADAIRRAPSRARAPVRR